MTLRTERLHTVEQLRGFLDGNGEVDFKPLDRDEAYGFVRRTLVRLEYDALGRAALIFVGRVPTDAEYTAVAQGGYPALRATLRGLMTGPEFHEFLIRASNDRLLTDRDAGLIIDDFDLHFVRCTNEAYRRKVLAYESASERGGIM